MEAEEEDAAAQEEPRRHQHHRCQHPRIGGCCCCCSEGAHETRLHMLHSCDAAKAPLPTAVPLYGVPHAPSEAGPSPAPQAAPRRRIWHAFRRRPAGRTAREAAEAVAASRGGHACTRVAYASCWWVIAAISTGYQRRRSKVTPMGPWHDRCQPGQPIWPAACGR